MKDSVSEPDPSDVNGHLERWIEQRTTGRVHCLCVETIGGRVIVHGHTGSYYVRQLALAAVLEALEASEAEHPEPVELDIVELDIEVGTARGRNSTHCVCGVARSRSLFDADAQALGYRS